MRCFYRAYLCWHLPSAHLHLPIFCNSPSICQFLCSACSLYCLEHSLNPPNCLSPCGCRGPWKDRRRSALCCIRPPWSKRAYFLLHAYCLWYLPRIWKILLSPLRSLLSFPPPFLPWSKKTSSE